METTEKTFLEKLAEYAKAQNAARPRPRKDKNVVEFLAVRSDIQKAIEDGYSVKIIWELLQREEKITYQYETFAKHVRRHIKGLKTDQKNSGAKPKEKPKPTIPDKTEAMTTTPETEKRGFIWNPKSDPKDLF